MSVNSPPTCTVGPGTLAVDFPDSFPSFCPFWVAIGPSGVVGSPARPGDVSRDKLNASTRWVVIVRGWVVGETDLWSTERSSCGSTRPDRFPVVEQLARAGLARATTWSASRSGVSCRLTNVAEQLAR